MGVALSGAANALWYLLCLPESLAFRRAGRRLAETQERLLLALLRRNADSVIGRRASFASIRSAREYQQRVPLSAYDDYAADLECIAAGERAVLTEEPVLLLEQTSGSSAPTKLIPYTAALKAEFQRGIAPWIEDLYRHDPRLMLGQAYWSVTPVAQRNLRSSGGIPIGFEEDSEYFGRAQRSLVRAVLAVPPLVRLIEDMESFRYVTLLFLLRCRSLRLVSVWNPTFLTLLLARLPGWQQALIADIEAGDLRPPGRLDPDLREQLLELGGPDPRRAAELRSMVAAAHEPAELHRRIWPGLRLVSCWADAHAALYARELARQLPQARVQGKGLIATEAFVSLPLSGHLGAALAARSHFFEFRPDENPPEQPPLLAHELEPGARYSVIVTTGGGLYRYRLWDRVLVTGHAGGLPLLRFAGREDLVSDRFGEKLNEQHVRGALDRLLQQAQLTLAFAMVAYVQGPPEPAYALFVEAQGAADGQLVALGAELEAALQESFHYRYCRQLGQLGALRVFRVEAAGHERYLEACQAAGQRAGNIKPVALHRADRWDTVFAGRFLDEEQRRAPDAL